MTSKLRDGKVRLCAASREDIAPLAASMRDADVREVGALGRSPEQALRSSLASSLWALTAFEGDVPIAMLGVSPHNMMEGIGTPWMLGSERIYDNARTLVQLVPDVVAEMRVTFPRLENYVARDNARAIAFLRHFGWQVDDEPIEMNGVEFVRFA